MEQTIKFEVANATSENVNVVNTTSENANVVSTTSNEQTKKTRKMKKLNESFEKRIMKNGQFRTDKFKLDEVTKIIELAENLKKAIEEENKTKNVNKVISLVQKLNMSKEEIGNLMNGLAAMKTAA
jgi:predicted nucleotidyltransferase